MNRILLLFIFLAGCNSFEYSPNQIFDGDSPRDLNKINLRKLEAKALHDDTVTIAFVGDSQRFYDDVEDFVDNVNALQSVDFILLAGDITDFGLLREYEWIEHEFSRLKAPYLAVIGNHDVVGNGEDVFKRMFGPLNYSFIYDSIKFVVHNTNSREYVSQSVPDLEWLAGEMSNEPASPVKHIVAVSHVPPMNDDFNLTLVEPYTKLFASTPRFLVSLHGHIHEHTDGYPFNDGTRYITSFAFSQRAFVLLKIVNGEIEKELIEY
jgi:3',5'-cyclic-AMP phosphodiesterase